MARNRGRQYVCSRVPDRVPDPTIEEIKERAAAIRATWDEKTHEERRVWNGRREWTLPWIGVESIDFSAIGDTRK